MNALSETPNYYIDELLKLETLTLFIVPLFVSLAAAVMIITDMVKNIEAVE